MSDNVYTDSSASTEHITFNNNTYAILAANWRPCKAGIYTDLLKWGWSDQNNAIHKCLGDASGSTNTATYRVFFANSSGDATSDPAFVYNSGTLTVGSYLQHYADGNTYLAFPSGGDEIALVSGGQTCYDQSLTGGSWTVTLTNRVRVGGSAYTGDDTNSAFYVAGKSSFSCSAPATYPFKTQYECDSSTFYIHANRYYNGSYQLYDSSRASGEITISCLANNSYITFATVNSNTASCLERARIDCNGHFGLGTTTPNAYARFTVKNAGTTNCTLPTSDTNADILIDNYSSSAATTANLVLFAASSTTYALIGRIMVTTTDTSNSVLKIQSRNGTNQNYADAISIINGKVGFQIDTPQNQLHLNSSASAKTVLQVTNGVSGNSTSINGALFGLDASGNVQIRSGYDGVTNICSDNGSGGDLILLTVTPTGTTFNYNNSGTATAIISYTGSAISFNVPITTATTINNTLALNNSISISSSAAKSLNIANTTSSYGNTWSLTANADGSVQLGSSGGSTSSYFYVGPANLIQTNCAIQSVLSTGTAPFIVASTTMVSNLNAAMVNGLSFDTSWTDYSSTSTVTGWASYVTKTIKYIDYGKFVMVSYYISGPSNSTSTNFTVPFTVDNSGMTFYDTFPFCTDNGTPKTAPGRVSMSDGGSAVVFMPDASGNTAWTASGTKMISGTFIVKKA